MGAMVSIRRRTCCMAGVSPIRSGDPSAALSRVSSAAVLLAMSRRSATRFKQNLELGPLARLGQIIEGTQPQRLHGRVDRGVPGQDDHLRLGADLLDLCQDLDSATVRAFADRAGPHRTSPRSRARSAAVPSGQTVTSCPSRGSSICMRSRRWASSSANRIRNPP